MKPSHFILLIIVVLYSIVEFKFYLQEKKMRDKRKEDEEQ